MAMDELTQQQQSDHDTWRCPHCSAFIIVDDLHLDAVDYTEFVGSAVGLCAKVTCDTCGSMFLWPVPRGPAAYTLDGEKNKKKKKKLKKGKHIWRLAGCVGLVFGTALAAGVFGLATVVTIPLAFVTGGAALFAVCGLYACGYAWRPVAVNPGGGPRCPPPGSLFRLETFV